jgi:hypothetical protein
VHADDALLDVLGGRLAATPDATLLEPLSALLLAERHRVDAVPARELVSTDHALTILAHTRGAS